MLIGGVPRLRGRQVDQSQAKRVHYWILEEALDLSAVPWKCPMHKYSHDCVLGVHVLDISLNFEQIKWYMIIAVLIMYI